jgi:hypothetical protein
VRAVGEEVFEATDEAREALLSRLDALARDVAAQIVPIHTINASAAAKS